MTHECCQDVPIGVINPGEAPAEAALDTGHPANMQLAEADGNRTRQRRGTPLSGFEDQGNHQESRRLRPRLY
jgi:hypothetical protein